jgi:CRP-like cAMP-binding protein
LGLFFLQDVTLGEGGFFGERALLLNEPRAANVYAQTAVQCLIMDRQSFNDILGPLKELIDANMSLNVLASVPLLKGLTTSERNELVTKMGLRSYRDGEYIIKQVLTDAHTMLTMLTHDAHTRTIHSTTLSTTKGTISSLSRMALCS